MTKPSPIAIIACCIIAISMLAFTLNDQFGNKKARISTTLGTSKNDTTSSLFVNRNPAHGEPGHRHELPDGAPLPVETGAVSTTANNLPQSASTPEANTAVNPAHGQPGHNCNIPVGAPLNDASVTTAASSTPASNAGLNPAHGQPGHRCDIAIGAPLNSTPQKNSTTTTNNIATSSATAITNNAVASASGLNPAHGQPGHRCDISVGAPLNSPAKSTATPNNSAIPNYNFSPLKDSTQSTSKSADSTVRN